MENIYEILPKCLCRTPVGNIEKYKELFYKIDIDQNEIMQYAVNDKTFMDGILCASKSLYDAILVEKSKDAYTVDILEAVMKYLIRYLTRSTPYGEFSGVGIIEFDNKYNTDIIMNYDKIGTRTRIDMGWLYGFINFLLNEADIKDNLYFHFNNNCYVVGDRLVNPYYSVHGISEGIESIRLSFNYSTQVKNIQEFCGIDVSYKKIIDYMKQLNTTIDERKIKVFVNELIKNEVLICEIYPPLINTDPLNYVIAILKKRCPASKWINYLLEIQFMMKKHDNFWKGNKSNVFIDICEKMGNIYTSKEYLQIDSQVYFEKKMLGKNVREKVEMIGNLLFHFASSNPEYEYITEYKERFIDKYGFQTAVPLLEMLDEEIGIGAPLDYKNPKSRRITRNIAKNDKKIQYIKNMLYGKAFLSGNNEGIIYLYDSDIETIRNKFVENGYWKEHLPYSFELYLSIIADSIDELNDDKYHLLFSGCNASSAAGNSFGRFSDFVEGGQEYIHDILVKELELTENIAELYEQPRVGRTANVEITNVNAPLQIISSINSVNDIKKYDLNEIYIGIDADNMFYAKVNNNKLYIKTTNMMNTSFGSNAYRFLRDISTLHSKIDISSMLLPFKNQGTPFSPRIVYDNLILAPKSWYIDEAVWTYSGKDIKLIRSMIEQWKKKYRVPDLINYEELDNILLLNLNNDLHIKLLYQIFVKKKNIILTEVFPKYWIKDTNGNTHNNEFVFSFVKKADTNIVKDDSLCTYKEKFNTNNKRSLFIGEEGWFFFKFYIDIARVDSFISTNIKQLVNELISKKICSQYFFIRYCDTREHIRFRIKIIENNNSLFWEHYLIWQNQCKEEGILFDVSTCTYEREIERYGGFKLIEYAERFFMEDSILVQEILCLQEETSDFWKDSDAIAILCINDLMINWGMNIDEREKWLSLKISPKDYRKEFKENEQKYRKYMLQRTPLDENISLLHSLLYNRKKAILEYKCAIDQMYEEGLLTNIKEEILSSLIHMFCNRFKADNLWEKKVRALTRHTLHSVRGFLNNNKNRC